MINGNYYIGSTKNIGSRYRTHLYTLKNNKSGCLILQNAINKYGIDNFIFECIEFCDNYKLREIEILNQLKPKYNCIIETVEKREISDETRSRMSIATLESYRRGNRKFTSSKGIKKNREKMSSVKLIHNTEILEFNNIKECANSFDCTVQAIYNSYYRNYLLKNKYKVIIQKH